MKQTRWHRFVYSLVCIVSIFRLSEGARPDIVPDIITTCESELDCPARSYCYKFNSEMTTFLAPTDATLVAQGDSFFAHELIGKPTGKICMCYTLYGVGGIEPYDWEPSSPTYLQRVNPDDTCNEFSDDHIFLLALTTATFIFALCALVIVLKTAFCNVLARSL